MGKKKNKKLPKNIAQPKKQRKKMNPETKAKLFTGLKTIYSNQACIDAGRNLTWWIPLLLALCGIMLALLPSLVSRLSTNIGETLLGSTTYNLDTSLVHFTDDIQEAGASLTIEDGEMTGNNWTSMKTSEEVPWYQYRDTASDKVTFEVFFNDSAIVGDDEYMTYVADSYNPYTGAPRTDTTIRRTSSNEEEEDEGAYLAISPKLADEEETSEEESSEEGEIVDENTYLISRIIFGKEYFRVYVYNTEGTLESSLVGSYDRLNGAVIPDYFVSGVDITLQEDPSAYIEAITTNWKQFFVESYETMKVVGAWELVGIMGAVYVGLVFLMGLVVFLLCRGKNNPYRVITFWESQKIAYWSTFSPGILALIFGFMFSSYSLFLFIIFFGARLMWMSFKSLRPSYNSSN